MTGQIAAGRGRDAQVRAAALTGIPASEVLRSPEWAPLMDALAREAAAQEATAQARVAAAEMAGPVTALLAELEQAVEAGRRPRGWDNLAVLAACERAERLGRPLNAVVALIGAPERAASGPLAGQPVAVKDIIAVRGVPTRCGSPAGDPAPAADDAVVVRRLRDAGAEVFATTQCLEYAAGFAHPAIGDTRNPRDVSRTSGGSSGGSAAVVAAGVCEAALGTDTGGSIRIPAAYCGVVGLKPTLGLLPANGVFPLSPTCDHVGTLTATAAGALSLLPLLAGWPADGQRNAGQPDTGRPDTGRPDSGRPVTAGVLTAQLADPSVTPEVGDAVDAALGVLAAAGWAVREVTAPWLAELPAWEEVLAVIVSREAWQVHRSRDLSGYAEGTRALLELGASVSDGRYQRALEQRAGLTAAVEASLAGVDVLAGPAVGYPAPEQDPPFGVGEDHAEGRFIGPYNLTGHPALSMPVPTAGLPVGLQLAARRDQDLALLRAAAQAERLLAQEPSAGTPHSPAVPEE